MPDLIQKIMQQDAAEDMLTTLIGVNKQFDPYFHNLTDDTKKGLNNMAEGREGLARLVSKIALANPDDLSRKDDPKELEERLDFDARMEGLKQQAMQLVEKITETQLANGHDLMTYVKAYRASLENNRNRNSALDEAMAPVDAWYQRYANTGDTAKPADGLPGNSK